MKRWKGEGLDISSTKQEVVVQQKTVGCPKDAGTGIRDSLVIRSL